MSETTIQKSILDWLKKKDCYVFKTIQCNRAGIPDIIGCTPHGTFFAVEVKYGNNKPSKLQEYNIEQIKQRGGIAFAAWDKATVVRRLTEYL